MSKSCSKCGVSKSLDEFYVRGGKTSHGKVVTTLHSICKECCKARIARNQATKNGKEYETAEEYRARIAASKKLRIENLPKSKRQKEIDQWRNDGCLEWAMAMKRELARAVHTQNALVVVRSDPWKAKFMAVVRGMATRKYLQPVIVKKITQQTSLSWDQGIAKAKCRYATRMRRLARIAADPWYRTMETKSRNWRRKVTAKRQKRLASMTS